MDITFLGYSCFKIRGKNTIIVIDPYSPEVSGLKLGKVSADIVLVTHNHPGHNNISAVSENPFVVTGPGEYEIKGTRVFGLPTFHDKENGSLKGKNTMYQITIDGINILHCGDLGHTLPENILGQLEDIQVLMVPIGGNSTITSKEALVVVIQVEPQIIIPMHYAKIGKSDKTEKLERSDIAEVDQFLKELGQDVKPVEKLTVTKDKLPEETQLVVLEAKND